MADQGGGVGGGPQQKRTPVPTPRKSVTLPMEVETSPSPPTENTFEVTEVVMLPPPERSQSALGDRTEKKISFSVVHSGGHPGGQTKKLSTFSLHATSEPGAEVGLPEEAPLQRRNSIHNVPYVDVNDPSTRERMERYKEERRSMLRAKYKVEDYMTSTTEANNKYRRKSTEQQQQHQNHENNSTSSVQLRKESAPATLNLKTTTNGTTKIIDKKSNSSPVRETGLIDEDVNVKERAAIFGVTTTNSNSSSNNRSKSWATTNNLNIAKNEINKRPMSESHVNTNSRKLSPGSPSKIRDMAALFEQKN